MEESQSYYAEVASPLFLVIVGVTIANCLDKLGKQLLQRTEFFVWQQALANICLLLLAIPMIDFLHDVKCYVHWNSNSTVLLFVPLTLYCLATSCIDVREIDNYWKHRVLLHCTLLISGVFFLISQVFFFSVTFVSLDSYLNDWNIYLLFFILFSAMLTLTKNKRVHSAILVMCAYAVVLYVTVYGGLNSIGDSYLCRVQKIGAQEFLEDKGE